MACVINGCAKPVLARGWCGMHYSRWYKHGDPEVTMLATCKHCGSGFEVAGTWRKYCSAPCSSAAAQQRQSIPCARCKGPVRKGSGTRPEGQAICKPCRKANPEPYKSPMVTATCRVCDTEFEQPRRGHLRTTCSPACSHAARRAARQTVSPLRQCEVCGAGFRPTHSRQRTCGRTCGIAIRRREGSLPSTPVSDRPLIHRVWFKSCASCGDLFTARSQRQVFCRKEACRSERHRLYMNANYERYKDRLLKAAHTRRARIAQAEREDIDPLKVYERDKWMCQVCRKRVRRKPKRLRDPLMASLDHVVPIVEGGAHTYANVRCTHLKCNLSRGARGGGEQLALVG